jgi:CBS domain-containing protein
VGVQEVDREADAAQLRVFIGRLLRDLRALEQMLADGLIESGVRRIGAEQELFLVDPAWRPAPVAMEILEGCEDPRYTTELGRFNLEINLDPLDFAGDCLGRMERQLETLLAHLRTLAGRHGAEVVLTGILPTIRKSDLALANMTPRPRYIALSRALDLLRGGPYEFQLKGTDELIVKHESMMLEACCTSFQVHYQVDPDRFALLYNLAQAMTAPLLAAATNSPLLFGRRLWRETRIPLFQQAVDTRSASHHMRERSPRVSFGRQWIERSVLDLFQEDLARFRVLLGAPLREDSLESLKRGVLPGLEALRLHNGTVYRWNRACIGVGGGKAHLRIENRVLPAGPTVLDEVANAAFFLGLMSGGVDAYGDVTKRMAFHDAEHNFLAAAQVGLDAQFTWMDARVMPARELISELLPVARQGLREAGILADDIDRYLGVISDRVSSGRTGSQWLLQSLASMQGEDTRDALLSALTAATATRQWEGKPVHEWPLARLGEGNTAAGRHDLRIEEFMTTDLCTVHPDEPVDLVANLMDWKHIRHVPVENEQGVLVGVVSCFEMFRHFARNDDRATTEPVAVSTIMTCNPRTVAPETLVLDAIALMRQEGMDCLLVVKEDRLVGIVTERDILNITTRLLANRPRGSAP